jgi:CxxC motif-containing protein (DUF1111 family)
VVFYLQTLKEPLPRNEENSDFIQGKTLFINIGCEKCHEQTLQTGYSAIAPLSNKQFHPFTDLLLHDMGNALDDGYTEGSAKTSEWRTPPLWGLGLSPNTNSISQNGKYIHRFGKKAAAFNLLHQTANAYNQDMGITSTFEPMDVYSGLEIDPEVSDLTIRNVVFYLQTLKEPLPRNEENSDFIQGKTLFINIGCEKCHKQTLQTGYSAIAPLSNKQFHPYTDLLLHDMGNALDDGYTEGSAKTGEWRTPPLWGLGLSPNSQGGNFFLMHDGRAKTIEEAIQLHGGESLSSKNKFNLLTAVEKKAVLFFLNSL